MLCAARAVGHSGCRRFWRGAEGRGLWRAAAPLTDTGLRLRSRKDAQRLRCGAPTPATSSPRGLLLLLLLRLLLPLLLLLMW